MSHTDVTDALRAQLEPHGDDLAVQSNGAEKWWNYIAWGTSYLVPMGWLVKDGTGTWRITDDGRAALQQYPDPQQVRAVAVRAYQDGSGADHAACLARPRVLRPHREPRAAVAHRRLVQPGRVPAAGDPR